MLWRWKYVTHRLELNDRQLPLPAHGYKPTSERPPFASDSGVRLVVRDGLLRQTEKSFRSPALTKAACTLAHAMAFSIAWTRKTGAIRWRKEGLERVDSAPTLHDGTVFFAAIDDTLYALKSESGAVRWRAQFLGVGYQNPKLLNKILYITGEGQLLGLDPSNGKVLRRYAFMGEGGDFSWTFKAIAVTVNRDVEFKDYTGKGSVVCFAQDAVEPRWTTPLGGACLGTLVCDENNCYLGARDGFFYAIRMTDGKIAWRIDGRRLFSQPGRAVWADGRVIDLGIGSFFASVTGIFRLHQRLHWQTRALARSSGPFIIPRRSKGGSLLPRGFSWQWRRTASSFL